MPEKEVEYDPLEDELLENQRHILTLLQALHKDVHDVADQVKVLVDKDTENKHLKDKFKP
jgi:hypothetical protein